MPSTHSGAARAEGGCGRLEMKRSTLQKRMKKLGMSRPNQCHRGHRCTTRAALGRWHSPPVPRAASTRLTRKSRRPPVLRGGPPAPTPPARPLPESRAGNGRKKAEVTILAWDQGAAGAAGPLLTDGARAEPAQGGPSAPNDPARPGAPAPNPVPMAPQLVSTSHAQSTGEVQGVGPASGSARSGPHGLTGDWGQAAGGRAVIRIDSAS
jgi:hypothetical protein